MASLPADDQTYDRRGVVAVVVRQGKFLVIRRSAARGGAAGVLFSRRGD